MIDDVFGIPRYKALLDFDTPVTQQQHLEFETILKRLQLAEPLQYITGKTHFRDLELMVSPAVLIPRPETEEMIELSIADINQRSRILDIGTGSGCIAISLAKIYPEAQVLAIDISKDALEIARKNAKLNNVTIQFENCDIFDLPESFCEHKLDVIISNPPYVTESDKSQMHKNVLAYEPSLALFVPDKEALKYYQAICGFARKCLSDKGVIWVEINENFGLETLNLFRSFFKVATIVNDNQGKNRFIRISGKI